MTMVLNDKPWIFLLDGVNEITNTLYVTDACHVLNAEDYLISPCAESDNVPDNRKVIFVSSPVSNRKGDGRLKEPSSLHHNFCHSTHISYIVQKGKASPYVYVHLRDYVFDHIFRIRSVTKKVGLPDQRLKQDIRHKLSKNINLLKGTFPAVHYAHMPARAAVTFGTKEPHFVIVWCKGLQVIDPVPVLEV